jgi:hypothetical protein
MENKPKLRKSGEERRSYYRIILPEDSDFFSPELIRLLLAGWGRLPTSRYAHCHTCGKSRELRCNVSELVCRPGTCIPGIDVAILTLWPVPV